MTSKSSSKHLTDLIVEKMIKKLENQNEFDPHHIEALKQLANSDSMTKTQSIIDAIKLKGADEKNETNQS